MRPTCDVTEQLSTMISHSYGKTDLPDTYANGAVEGVLVAGVRVDAVDYAALSEIISKWIQTPSDRGRYVVQGNAQHVVEFHTTPEFRATMVKSDVTVPDGVPLVWCLKRVGFKDQTQTRGPDAMLVLLERAEIEGWKVGLYGGKEATLEALVKFIHERFPKLYLAYVDAPPFRDLNEEEKSKVRMQIAEIGINLLFVGLGCPKQERWMHDEVAHIHCVMIGVGAAFDFHAGIVKRAPSIYQHLGLEWFYRLLTEPKRLWKRYSRVVPGFAYLVLRPKSLRRL